MGNLWNALERTSLEACPCSDLRWCLPVENTSNEFEVFAFSYRQSDNWKYYDFSTLTTIAWNLDKNLLCHAHENGVKIVTKHNFDDVEQLCNQTARKEWIQNVYKEIVVNYADGVNIDTESAIAQHEQRQCLTLLVQELRQELQTHKFTKNAQITFDVAWSPNGVDQRYYDYKGLAQASDYVFVMAYDMRSQLYDHCLAGANSPIAQVKRGLDDYIIGAQIPQEKLILGLPWYGYQYPCTHFDPLTDLCSIAQEPFRGAPCSDAAGSQLDYGDIVARLATSNRLWDPLTATPYFHTKKDDQVVQIWYDDPTSLQQKFHLASSLGGIGMWHVDALDYSGKDVAVNSTRDMWTTLKNAVPKSDLMSLE
ncbi:Di-N-acetylchitobiase [Thraustotheca clavata]|uniref:Di-N-acetylchitobiase n=1 Tax=Thraustotheca clavata TaxID=74557 RepID=A0A1V9ZG08_9STRA|nr:Di-N-acetylchitobiase [Thraustotheca clavata]